MTFNEDVKITYKRPGFIINDVREVNKNLTVKRSFLSKASVSFEAVRNLDEIKLHKGHYNDNMTLLVTSSDLISDDSQFIVLAKFITKASYNRGVEYYALLVFEGTKLFLNGVTVELKGGEFVLSKEASMLKVSEHRCTGDKGEVK